MFNEKMFLADELEKTQVILTVHDGFRHRIREDAVCYILVGEIFEVEISIPIELTKYRLKALPVSEGFSQHKQFVKSPETIVVGEVESDLMIVGNAPLFDSHEWSNKSCLSNDIG